MQISNLTEKDVGRSVTYHPKHGAPEHGILSSWNEKYVFVRYTQGSTAAACDPQQLEFDH